ncbi:MAG: hypothetical protein J7L61_04570, partial [Thermoplasmata archaeon]|nr:hypothetical protein [Thermoplasmata archaeon]
VIRPTAVRTSDLLPPLVGEKRSHLYFPQVSNLISFTPIMYKHILYDYLFLRTDVLGKKTYSGVRMGPSIVSRLKEEYRMRMNGVIGLGVRIGDFWFPRAGEGANDGEGINGREDDSGGASG